ncbi:hypothetical protein TUM17387_07550 [Shewanella carassii]|nr:hypothetical protein TUM17387_07550 [Shewanella carassii]
MGEYLVPRSQQNQTCTQLGGCPCTSMGNRMATVSESGIWAKALPKIKELGSAETYREEATVNISSEEN